MRIAVTYDNGNVFQHFGHTESFKLYEVQGDKVISTLELQPDASGHDGIAAFLAENDVNAVICGGLGDGAKNALDNAGIEVVSGVQGSADEAVESYLKGELVSEGVNCDHHGHQEDGSEPDSEGCGSSCGSGCGGGCGGCGGGCGAPIIYLEGPNAGKTVRVHYTGTFDDGTKFDSSYDRGEPLEFICGAGMMIKGFDKAVVDMEVGQKISVHLMPSEAYGEYDPAAMVSFDIDAIPGAEDVEVGMQVYLQDAMGRPIPVKVHAKENGKITFDANHEMAGKELNFEIELVEVK